MGQVLKIMFRNHNCLFVNQYNIAARKFMSLKHKPDNSEAIKIIPSMKLNRKLVFDTVL